MVDKTEKVSRDGFVRLQSAATEFARGEIKRLAQVVIEELRTLPANDSFGDVAARHLSARIAATPLDTRSKATAWSGPRFPSAAKPWN